MRRLRSALLAALFAVAAPAAASSVADEPSFLGTICHAEAATRIAGPHRLVMLPGMGNDHMAADTRSADAQRWFDYGLTLGRSFEHGDAVLAFQRAEAADPTCSLCAWGEAWASGPNINFGPPPAETPRLLALAKKAEALRQPDADDRIRWLENALVDRYQPDKGDQAYAHDLDVLQRSHPDDVEVAIFDAEAWLIMENSHGDPSGPTRAVQVLGPLLPAHPDDSGLIHFYVHATEDAGEPELAAPYAGRLGTLAPSASHMVHMPSHTWFRLGRYEQAAQDNLAALRADQAYATATDFPTPLGGLTYHAHDIAFGLAAASMSGDGVLALQFVHRFLQDFPSLQAYPRAESAAARAYVAFGRFDAPQRVLGAPDSVAARPFLEAMRHFARGEAYLRLGRVGEARAEAALVTLPSSGPALDPVDAAVTQIAQLTLQGDADLLEHRPDAAIDAFTRAASLQETRLERLDDPPPWIYPVRRRLAAALMAKGDAAGALRESSAVLQAWKLDPVALDVRARAERQLGQGGAAGDEAAARAGWRGDPAELRGPV